MRKMRGLFLHTMWRRALHQNVLQKKIKNFLSPALRYRMASNSTLTYQDVLHFWFEEPKNNQERMKLWFGGGPEQDSLIKDKFGDLVKQARNGELSHWEDLSCGGPKSGLAFVLLIDQFCRNIYRGTGDMFSHDHKALAVALKIINEGSYKQFTPAERFCLYLPLEHHEDKETQVRCLELYTELAEETKGTEDAMFGESGVKYSLQHKGLIDRFGRYPKRNAPLGRNNTPEEEKFLKEEKFDF
ncbi:uncharacterized protein LOC130645873 [Hydractinia symbiolongicarpus]|uniref:uncharacterized protein LOC130645873 n=1 Tax=Hydractinia symbiolongicarpus TaxID=13093 RepID=UPI00254D1314|nr:uncharacterized protein LOC130645873 [Hydractinia symbiolongicarpus]